MRTSTHPNPSRRNLNARAALLGVGAALALCAGASAAETPVLSIQSIATGLNRPVEITHAGDGSGRLFIVQQTGQIRIYDGALLATPFLDIAGLVNCCGERGLLGLAFHPDYETNGHFFVHYSDSAGDTVIARYTVSAGNPNVANPASALTILTWPQDFGNHNGGKIAFGPDGYLYIGLGDGGSGGDPNNRAQSGQTLLGKLLRLDVDNSTMASPYAIPPSNPFVGTTSVLSEIWALGLRNPWRFNFDRATGDLILGDVGQGAWEEIDFQPASSPGGENYGWRCYEGNTPFNTSGCGPVGNYKFPVLVYSHSLGCSVTGGFRYRGVQYPNLWGYYLYGDFCSGTIWGGRPGPSGWTTQALLSSGLSIGAFGEDEAGELYVAHTTSSGVVYRIVDGSAPDVLLEDGFENGNTLSWTLAVTEPDVLQRLPI